MCPRRSFPLTLNIISSGFQNYVLFMKKIKDKKEYRMNNYIYKKSQSISTFSFNYTSPIHIHRIKIGSIMVPFHIFIGLTYIVCSKWNSIPIYIYGLVI